MKHTRQREQALILLEETLAHLPKDMAIKVQAHLDYIERINKYNPGMPNPCAEIDLGNGPQFCTLGAK